MSKFGDKHYNIFIQKDWVKDFFFSPLNADRGNNLQGKTKAEYWQKLSIKKLQQAWIEN